MVVSKGSQLGGDFENVNGVFLPKDAPHKFFEEYVKLEFEDGELVEEYGMGYHSHTPDYLSVIEEVNRQIV